MCTILCTKSHNILKKAYSLPFRNAWVGGSNPLNGTISKPCFYKVFLLSKTDIEESKSVQKCPKKCTNDQIMCT